MNKEELKQALTNGYIVEKIVLATDEGVIVVEADLLEAFLSTHQDLPAFEVLHTSVGIRSPEEIKKQIKYEKNPMRLKQLNRELNDSYNMYRKRGGLK